MSEQNVMSIANGLESWYTEEQAAQKLGISPRSFRRLILEGKSRDYSYAPEKRNRPRNGKKPEPVFHPEQVDALAKEAGTHPTTRSSYRDAVQIVLNELRACCRALEDNPEHPEMAIGAIGALTEAYRALIGFRTPREPEQP